MFDLLFDAVQSIGLQAIVLAVIYAICSRQFYFRALIRRDGPAGRRARAVLALPFFAVLAVEIAMSDQFDLFDYGFGFLFVNVFCVSVLSGVWWGGAAALVTTLWMGWWGGEGMNPLYRGLLLLTNVMLISAVAARRAGLWRRPRQVMAWSVAIGILMVAGYKGITGSHLADYWQIDTIHVLLRSIMVFLIFIVINRVHEEQNQDFVLRGYQQEMDIARTIQHSLLPAGEAAAGGWQVFGSITPCKDVGGDLLYYRPVPDGGIGFVVGDVTDKGMPAAVFMSFTYVFLLEQLGSDRPAAVLASCNEAFCAAKRSCDFITVATGLARPDGRLTVGNAGHCPPVIYRAATGSWHRPDWPRSLPLGVRAGRTFPQIEIELAAGDIVIIYSDGLTDGLAERWQGMDSFELLKRLLAGIGGQLSPQAMYVTIARQLARLGLADSPVDDTAVLILKRTG